jgi:hypothetical protein
MSTRLREIDDGEDRKTDPLDKDEEEKSNHGAVTGTLAHREIDCGDGRLEEIPARQAVADTRKQMRQMPLPEVLDLASIVECLGNEGRISYRYFVKRDRFGNLPNNIPRPSPAMVRDDIIDSITSYLESPSADTDGKIARLTRITKIVITIINGELFAVYIIAVPDEKDRGNDTAIGANADTDPDEGRDIHRTDLN